MYIFWFLHQTTTLLRVNSCSEGCISFDSYIKPQQLCTILFIFEVVYLLIPTSNHNGLPQLVNTFLLYIFWFLHQTTTNLPFTAFSYRCISFDSYIKPQLSDFGYFFSIVVYLLIPTSNHNSVMFTTASRMLYIFWFLHQTTTASGSKIPPFCCISFDSYIKPQRILPFGGRISVVYLLIPTSNHNHRWGFNFKWWLYIFWFLHQTTTGVIIISSTLPLYIFWFLHQTTTMFRGTLNRKGCISFDSYIKPQR